MTKEIVLRPYRIKDLTGQTFHRLTALRCVGQDKHRHAIWLCRCSCDGREIEIQGTALLTGNAKSCGCWRRVVSQTLMAGWRGTNSPNWRHGHAYHSQKIPTYMSWAAMIERCTNPKITAHKHYFDAGITVCDRWRNSFEAFLEDLGERPEGCTLGRFGDIGNYEPENCAWQTKKEQVAEQKMKRQLQFIAA